MAKIRKIPKQLMSKKIISLILDDVSFFGSIPFFLFITGIAFFFGNNVLFSRMAYTFLLSLIIVIAIKSVHYKDRPQKEEFSIFMEKMVASSFPSSHSVGVTALSILVSIAYPFVWVIAPMTVISILVYLQRYITKKHFVMDIVGGIFIAIAEVIFVIKIL